MGEFCPWCGVTMHGDDETPSRCSGRYACSQRKAFEDGQEYGYDEGLEDSRARAERAEAYIEKLKIDVSGFKGTIGELIDRVHVEMARAEKAERALDGLLEACERIAAIENRPVGGDWDEIEEARAIARAAIAGWLGDLPCAVDLVDGGGA